MGRKIDQKYYVKSLQRVPGGMPKVFKIHKVWDQQGEYSLVSFKAIPQYFREWIPTANLRVGKDHRATDGKKSGRE